MTSLTGNDLYHFHQCPHTLTMKLTRPGSQGGATAHVPEALQRLLRWGLDHEATYAEREGYETMPDFFTQGVSVARAAVLDAMRQGRPKLFQALLTSGDLMGVVDLLRRVPGASLLGEYHYEVGDVKSSGRAKAEQVMQVLFYTHLLESLQGTRPEHGFLVLADGTEWRFCISDYWDYFLSILEHAQKVLLGQAPTEPVLNDACDLCRWHSPCHATLVQAGDLSLVPGMTRSRRNALHRAGITTEDALRHSDSGRVVPGVRSTYFQRLHRQAQARHEGQALPLMRLPARGEDRIYLAVFTDFSRQDAVFALGVKRTGAQSAGQVFFADHPDAFDDLAADASAWLAGHRQVPWVVWDRWAARAVERTFGHLQGVSAIEVLSRTVWDSWALPVNRYDLPEVAGALALPAHPQMGAAAPPLQYHLYLAEGDLEIRQNLERHLAWDVAVMAGVDQWMQVKEGGA